MSIGMLMCASCGKTIPASEAILFQGKTFCSEECKKDSITLS